MRNVILLFVICFLLNSCIYGEQKAEDEVSRLQNQIDTISHRTYVFYDDLGKRVDELSNYVSDEDTFAIDMINAIREKLDEYQNEMEDLTIYPNFEFSYCND